MSGLRHAKRRDANEPDVIKALERVGAKVKRLHEFDLLVYFRGQVHMLEVKTEKGVLKDSQRDMMQEGWPLKIVRSEKQALAAIGAQDVT
ncbi:MAG: hypothetical protein MJA83_10365 [Gammaproteobacteria bacterium]|nr:hypothetical protein [Gammaproteobacteria bacterium]